MYIALQQNYSSRCTMADRVATKSFRNGFWLSVNKSVSVCCECDLVKYRNIRLSRMTYSESVMELKRFSKTADGTSEELTG